MKITAANFHAGSGVLRLSIAGHAEPLLVIEPKGFVLASGLVPVEGEFARYGDDYEIYPDKDDVDSTVVRVHASADPVLVELARLQHVDKLRDGPNPVPTREQAEASRWGVNAEGGLFRK